jgi:hypothetical protein
MDGRTSFSVGVFFYPEDGGDVSPKRRLTFNGLHDVISQKIIVFITTALRTSNRNNEVLFCAAVTNASRIAYKWR